MKTRTVFLIRAAVAAGLISGAAQATLIDRGGGLIYDDQFNVTWLQDANYAKTSGYDADGRMNWNDAMTWASNLSYFDSVRNVTYTDWRLPTTLQPDPTCSVQLGGISVGDYCTGSEMGHMFYTALGGMVGQSITTTHNADFGLFTNLQAIPAYWSSTELATDIANFAWDFRMNEGDQYPEDKSNLFLAWAVRDGVSDSVI